MVPVALLLAVPGLVSAQLVGGGDAGPLGLLMQNIVIFINDSLIPFILALAFLMFVWGVVRYFIIGAASEESREAGKSLMIYSIAGFVIILIFWGVVNLLAESTGLTGAEEAIGKLQPKAIVPGNTPGTGGAGGAGGAGGTGGSL